MFADQSAVIAARASVMVDGEQTSAPTYVSGVDWGLPGFGDTQITKNLQQLLAAGRPPH